MSRPAATAVASDDYIYETGDQGRYSAQHGTSWNPVTSCSSTDSARKPKWKALARKRLRPRLASSIEPWSQWNYPAMPKMLRLSCQALF